MKATCPSSPLSLLAALVALAMSMFTVDQRRFAIVFQLGEIKDVITEPGLNFKWPLIQNVRTFDKRILTYDSPEPERFITSEKKNGAGRRLRQVADHRCQAVLHLGAGRRGARPTRLAQTVNAGSARGVRQAHVHDVVSGERDRIMETMRTKADADARAIGVQIVDVRLKRVDLPQEVSESVYRRMETERKRVANELRSKGAAEAEKIRADADRQREIIIAEAYRDAQRLKGEGDAKAAAIYAAPSARTRSSTPSTAASRPTAPASAARATCW
jgi:membrane protease subunit HflC